MEKPSLLAAGLPLTLYPGVHMKTSLSTIALLLMLAPPLLSSCSKEPEHTEKGVIEQQTDKVAQEAVNMIKIPLDQAKQAAEQAQAHERQLDKQLGSQE